MQLHAVNVGIVWLTRFWTHLKKNSATGYLHANWLIIPELIY